jgi:hypothetical protein
MYVLLSTYSILKLNQSRKVISKLEIEFNGSQINQENNIKKNLQFEGFSNGEPWGRWTDFKVNKNPSITLRNGIFPNKIKVTIHGRNLADGLEPTCFAIGGQQKCASLRKEFTEINLEFDSIEFGTSKILIKPPLYLVGNKSGSPHNDDSRELGIGLISLKISKLD